MALSIFDRGWEEPFFYFVMSLIDLHAWGRVSLRDINPGAVDLLATMSRYKVDLRGIVASISIPLSAMSRVQCHA